MNYKTGKILQLMKKWELFKQQKFTEKDLRGLSKVEKEFIRNNGYHIVYEEKLSPKQTKVFPFVLFIARDYTGRKKLYAQSKMQLLLPNDPFEFSTEYRVENGMYKFYHNHARHNYEFWILPKFNRFGGCLDVTFWGKYQFEFRFGEIPPIMYPYGLMYR